MTLLQWSWTMRPGSYARASLANNRQLFVLCVVLGISGGAVAFLISRSALVGIVVGVLVLLLSPLLFVPRFRLAIRRQRRVSGADVRWYTFTPDALEIVTGRDRVSIPLADLSVLRQGRDWLSLRRRATVGGLFVLFDDPALVGQAAEIVARHGTTR